MSRVGKRTIIIPENVNYDNINNKVTIKGPLGTLEKSFSPLINIKKEENKLFLTRKNDDKTTKMLHGTTNSLITQMIDGVTKGFKKDLLIKGVGYNVKLVENVLIFSLGYSHKIELPIPESLKVEVSKPTVLSVSGIDKQIVGEFAAKIKSLKKPEPYGGKGIMYKDEKIIRKAGKSSSK